MSVLSKFNLALAVLGAFVSAQVAQAGGLVTLKQVQVSGGAQVDLLFDGKISKSQLKTEYFNDIIQISMTDVAVYPAKISSISGGDLLKVFAYQYAPRLVRCRISVRGKAEDFKDRFRIVTNSPGGKVLTLALDSAKKPVTASADSVSVSAAAPSRAPVGADMVRKPAETAAAAPKAGDPDERALLERVLKGTPTTVAAAAMNEAHADESPRAEAKSASTHEKAHATQTLGSAKPLPSFTMVFVKLALVLGIFGVIALIARKVLNLRQTGAIAAAVSGSKGKGILGSLGGKLGAFGNKTRLIEVLSTQHLGPKKSIAVVKVMERVLVLGISSDSITLITQLGAGSDPLLNLDGFEELEDLPMPEPKVRTHQQAQSQVHARSAQQVSKGPNFANPSASAPSGATAAGPSIFSDLLRAEASKPRITPTGPAPMSPASRSYLNAGAQSAAPSAGNGPSLQGPAYQSSIRAQIKSRIEGMKQL